jgi:thymidylate synthase (FAD)
MRILEPSVRLLWVTPRVLRTLERVARICYRSEDLIGPGTDEKLIRRLIAAKHEAMLEHASLSVLITCDRGITHELVRHRIASFAQESTRYVNYAPTGRGRGVKVVLPSIPELAAPDPLIRGARLKALAILRQHAYQSEEAYNALLAVGCKPQTARWVLPTGTASMIAVTANFREWRHFLSLRDSVSAHPDMVIIAKKIRGIIASRWPILLEGL